ncbi:MAG: VWA domain-containing protein [Planctomycetaceae bacterium]|nr:VWA domain-containing protein [Planctomycetaceae bacterium]
MRKLPIYFVLDTSESMVGEPINAVEQGLATMLTALRKDPYALESAYLSVITFGTAAKQIVPLTELSQFQAPKLTLGSGTSLGAALELLEKRISAEVTKSTASVKGDYKPLVFLMTDGEPTDRWETAADRLMKNRSLQLVAIGCGPDTNLNTLRRITELVVTGNEANQETLTKFFKWVSASVAVASQSVDKTGESKISLEKFPQDDNIKIVDETTPQQKIEPNRFVFLHNKCVKTKKFYIQKFVKSEQQSGGFFGLGKKDLYKGAGTFPLDDFEKLGSGGGVSVSADLLDAPNPCPYCRNEMWALCVCGKTHCAPEIKNAREIITLTCPWCNTTSSYGLSNFSVGGGGG